MPILPDSRELTPRTMLLDLLRMTRGRDVPVAELVEAGVLFGFSDSAVRVALTRLVAAGKVDTEAGGYRLGNAGDALGDYVEEWRLGEARCRLWDEASWLCVLLPRKPQRSERQRSLRCLQFLGFREVRDALWARPDNLARTADSLHRLLEAFGLEADALLFAAHALPVAETHRWQTSWPIDTLQARYQRMLDKLEQSRERLPNLHADAAMAETFAVGGEAIHVLIRDPLLPATLMDTRLREQLCESMREYDVLGRQVWARRISAIKPRVAVLASV